MSQLLAEGGSKEWGYNARGEHLAFALTTAESLSRYSSAGFMVVSSDFQYVLLGTHTEAPNLYGNFAGGRDPGESDPLITACREIEEELGQKVDPSSVTDEPLITILNYKLQASPKVGIIYPLRIDMGRIIKLPSGGEIKEVRWFTWDGVMELMDWNPHHVRLWGGYYTSIALDRFLEVCSGQTEKFGGKYEQSTHHGWETQYEELKRIERSRR